MAVLEKETEEMTITWPLLTNEHASYVDRNFLFGLLKSILNEFRFYFEDFFYDEFWLCLRFIVAFRAQHYKLHTHSFALFIYLFKLLLRISNWQFFFILSFSTSLFSMELALVYSHSVAAFVIRVSDNLNANVCAKAKYIHKKKMNKKRTKNESQQKRPTHTDSMFKNNQIQCDRVCVCPCVCVCNTSTTKQNQKKKKYMKKVNNDNSIKPNSRKCTNTQQLYVFTICRASECGFFHPFVCLYMCYYFVLRYNLIF